MIAILGWVLFAVTIVASIWRDVYQQLQAEKRYDDDLRYWEGKYKELLAEKQSHLARIDMLKRDRRNYQHNVAKLRKACAIIEATYDDEKGS
tara:strand:- start:1580 stop:1855 length:276 start_codon:yes stop_codon:yes gene_type:complete